MRDGKLRGVIRSQSISARSYIGGLPIGSLVFLLFAACIVAISLAFFASSIGTSYMGLMISHSHDGWVLSTVDPNGLAGQAGMNVGDRPVTINGEPASQYLKNYEAAGSVSGTLIDNLTVTNNKGTTISASLGNGPVPLRLEAEYWARFALILVFWAVGFYILAKRPRHLPALLFCLCGLAVGLALTANMADQGPIPEAVFAEVAASVIGPWLLFHFFLVLPEERAPLRRNPLTYLIYVPAAVTLILFPLIGYANRQPLPGFRSVRLLEYGVGFAAAVGIVAFNYFRASSTSTRQQMKIVFVSCLVAVVPVLGLNVLPQAIWGQPPVPPGFSFLFIGFIPVGVGYAILSQRLMNIDVVVRRGVVYVIVSLVMAGILSAATFGVEAFDEAITPPQQILIAVVLGIVAAGLFGPTKKGIEQFIDRFFYKDRYDYRQITQTLSISLDSVREFADVARVIVGTTVDTLNLAGACLFVRGRSDNLELSAAQGRFTDQTTQLRLSAWLAPARRDILTEFPNSASSIDPDLALLVPLVAEGKEVGVLCLSQKISRQSFSHDDLYLVQGLASVASMALRSATLVRDVSARDTFVSIASHELKTPLTAVIANADLIVHSDASDPKMKNRAHRILDGGWRISAIVDELLNVSRIQSGRIMLKLARVDLEPVLNESISMASETSSKHEFQLEIADDTPDVMVDRDKFGQIVWNLLSNAIKYSPDGGQIILSAHRDIKGRRVVVSVSDDGIGIGPQDRELLFTTFHRVQRPETVGIKGAGLGLYIVKEWTQAMGGEVWVESELNKGSTFCVAVPVADSEPLAHPD